VLSTALHYVLVCNKHYLGDLDAKIASTLMKGLLLSILGIITWPVMKLLGVFTEVSMSLLFVGEPLLKPKHQISVRLYPSDV
jgi:hypothetical protein